jgi:hypothetical protein
MWPLLALSLLYALVLWRLAVVVGYLSDRHVQVVVLCGIYPAAAAVLDLPGRLGAWLGGRGAAGWLLRGGGPVLAGAAYVGLIGSGLPRTLHPLHANRAGEHAAGLWLAGQAHPSDLVMDRHAWSHYYAGYVFREGQAVRPDPAHRPVCYHVVTRSKGGEPEPKGNDRFLTEPQLKALRARVVYHWPERRPLERASVLVYAVPRPDEPGPGG